MPQHRLPAINNGHSSLIQRDDIPSFRIQEAFGNDDGTKDVPHWDDWYPREGHLAIDEEEVDALLAHIGSWSLAWSGDASLRDGDHRAGYRRIVEVRDSSGRSPTAAVYPQKTSTKPATLIVADRQL